MWQLADGYRIGDIVISHTDLIDSGGTLLIGDRGTVVGALSVNGENELLCEFVNYALASLSSDQVEQEVSPGRALAVQGPQLTTGVQQWQLGGFRTLAK